MIGQNTHSRNIFSVHGFLNLSVINLDLLKIMNVNMILKHALTYCSSSTLLDVIVPESDSTGVVFCSDHQTAQELVYYFLDNLNQLPC